MYKFYNANALNKYEDDCVIRAISDSANGEASMDYPEFMRLAAENSINVMKKFLAECE